MIDQEFVKYVITALVNKPEEVKVERTVDERGVLLTLHVAEEDLGRVIGRKGTTAQSIRTLLRALGSKNEAHYNLRIMDNGQPRSGGDFRSESSYGSQAMADLKEDSGFATTTADDHQDDQTNVMTDSSSDNEEEQSEDSLDKTKRELDDLNDDLV